MSHQASRKVCVLENHFSYFSTITYVVGTQKNDGSFEHPKHMFKLMGKEINAILGAQTILIWIYVPSQDLGYNHIDEQPWLR